MLSDVKYSSFSDRRERTKMQLLGQLRGAFSSCLERAYTIGGTTTPPMVFSVHAHFFEKKLKKG
jgi:hypothetical protein